MHGFVTYNRIIFSFLIYHQSPLPLVMSCHVMALSKQRVDLTIIHLPSKFEILEQEIRVVRTSGPSDYFKDLLNIK